MAIGRDSGESGHARRDTDEHEDKINNILRSQQHSERLKETCKQKINQTKFYNYEQESNSILPYAGSYMEGPARPSINQYLCSQMEATTRYSPDYLWICI